MRWMICRFRVTIWYISSMTSHPMSPEKIATEDLWELIYSGDVVIEDLLELIFFV